MQRTETDGELSLLVYGGLFGKERNSRCFESIENDVQKVKLNCILLLCFWCNPVYSNDTVSVIDVLDSI